MQPSPPAQPAQTPSGIQLTPQQRECIQYLEHCRKNGLWGATVVGYAGTGKTTTMGAYVDLLVGQGLRVAVSAPTNKAVRVLKDKMSNSGVHCTSTHSLLGIRMVEYEDGEYQSEKQGDARIEKYHVVIVDECSMISDAMYAQLTHWRENTFLVFVGDPCQLPPVRSRNPQSLSFRDEQDKGSFVLAQIVRQAEGNPIVGFSMQIREAESRGERFDTDRIIAHVNACADQRLFLIQRQHVTDFLVNEQQKESGNQEEHQMRMVAWRNQQVQESNAQMHRMVYGDTIEPFAVGEMAVAHAEFPAQRAVKAMQYNPKTGSAEMDMMLMDSCRIVNSEEMRIMRIIRATHPRHPEIPAWQVFFQRSVLQASGLHPAGDDSETFSAFIPVDESAWEQEIESLWKQWREAKAKQKNEEQVSQSLQKRFPMTEENRQQIQLHEHHAMEWGSHAKTLSAEGWSLRKGFAQLRHVYACTAHKSQGSTWHTAVLDLGDLQRMPNTSEYNRALYVAVTRAAYRLAIAV
ncbi:AAA family ATPase [Acidithiobacillus sp. MC6.1]|nr:AAA family ATPase [Acidithiobacillus sp. MC6.1]